MKLKHKKLSAGQVMTFAIHFLSAVFLSEFYRRLTAT